MIETTTEGHANEVQDADLRLSCRCVRNQAELVRAWRLVYTNYRGLGLIPPNPQQLHTTQQACEPQSMTAIATRGRDIVATISCSPEGPAGLPLDEVYPEELAALRQRGRPLVEVGLLAAEGIGQSTMVKLMAITVAYTMHCGGDVVIGVHPRHVPFYHRIFGSVTAGTPRSYSSLNLAPVELVHLDLPRALELSRPPIGIAMIRRGMFGPAFFSDRFRPRSEHLLAAPNPIGGFLRKTLAEAA